MSRDEVRALDEAASAVVAQAHAELARAEGALRRGQIADALAIAGRCWTTIAAGDDARLQAEVQRVLCVAHQYGGNLRDSVQACYRALDLYEAAHHPIGVARTLSLGAISLVRIGDAGEAFDMLKRAYEIAQQVNDPATEFRVWVNMSVVHESIEEYDKAVAAGEAALVVAEAIGDPHMLTHMRTSLCIYRVRQGLAVHEAGHAEEARSTLLPALESMHAQLDLCRAQQCDHMLAAMLYIVGTARLALGETGAARAALDEGLAYARRAAMRTEESGLLRVLGETARSAGEHAAALEHLHAALRIGEGSDEAEVIAKCHLQLSRTHEAMGDLAGALAHFRRYHEVQLGLVRAQATTRAQVLSIRLDNERARLEAALFRLRAAELERDNHSLQTQAEQLSRHANEDALTGLGNRRHFERCMAQLFGAETAPVATLAIADIDHFKHVNDRFSHAVGDRVLQQVGALFREHCRAGDVVARFGGEEFEMAFVGIEGELAVRAADRLRERIERFDWSTIHPALRVTISIGLATCAAGVSAEQTLAEADAALYAAKDGGRNRVCHAPAQAPTGAADASPGG